MLNISENRVVAFINLDEATATRQLLSVRSSRWFAYLVMGVLVGFVVVLFLPWTQNIQAKGKVTTLYPEQRPQDIHATIGGRVERWYVREGQLVKAGDTIVFMSEIKEDYFDPQLLPRKMAQLKAKELSFAAYDEKATALNNQIEALTAMRRLKLEQARNKIRQTRLKVVSDSLDLLAAATDYQIAENQLQRNQPLLEQGIIPLADIERRTVKQRDAFAKRVATENKWLASQADYMNAVIELRNIENEYADKIAKANSDRFSALSSRFDSEGDISKLASEYANYAQRAEFYAIIAPQDGYVLKIAVNGIGETVKAGDKVVSILPAQYDLAVELYVRPMDLPLIHVGQEVRFIFDGWPAIVFRGWQGLTYGTFSGRVFAIDNIASDNGKYRILVSEADSEKPWPVALRPGSGANGIAMLNDVPLWYEIWRQLNGFPPDFYEPTPTETVKTKAPIRSVK